MEIRNSLSRRKFLGLAALGLPVVAGACRVQQHRAEPSPGSGERRTAVAVAAGRPPTGSCPASRSRASARTRSRRSTPRTPTGRSPTPSSRTTRTRPRSRLRSVPAQAPTIIWGWGGGGLQSYVKDGVVEDLTDWFAQNAEVKNRLFPSSFGAATINGKIYAMPCETVQPIILYWNKKVFDDVGVSRRSRGTTSGPGPEVQREEHRADLARRPVAVDQHDVARVPLRPHRRPGRVRGRVQRREERLVEPGRDPRAHRVPEAGQGQRLRQGLLVHHRRLQRRPGAALHRQGRDDAARFVDLRDHEGVRR